MTVDATKAQFLTLQSVDKIAAVLTGTFNTSTQVINRSYTFAGAPISIPFHRITHGFNRPVFVEFMWSYDNVVWVDGGTGATATGTSSIAYADDTYIYMSAYTLTAATTVYYRLICTWIDDYNSTAYNYTPRDIGAKVTNYTSLAQTPKIITQKVDTISTASVGMSDNVKTIAHNLGYVPRVKVYIESFANEVWPLNYGAATSPFNFDDSQVEAQVFIDTTNLYVDMYTKAANGSRRFWYRIYSDTA